MIEALQEAILILERLREGAETESKSASNCVPIRRRAASESSSLEAFEPMAARCAAIDYKHRRLRGEFIQADLLGEPLWDMLLDLFIQNHEGRRISVTGLVAASMAPDTTGLRCVELLCKSDLAIRVKSISDKRVTYIDLTAKAKNSIIKYYAAREGHLEPTAPRAGVLLAS